jgi:hypothetical protein
MAFNGRGVGTVLRGIVKGSPSSLMMVLGGSNRAPPARGQPPVPMIQRICRLLHFNCGQIARACADDAGLAAAAVNGLKSLRPGFLGVALKPFAFGFGHEFFKMYFPPGVIVSTPSVIHRPFMALTVQTVAGSNWGLPSTGTVGIIHLPQLVLSGSLQNLSSSLARASS